MRIATIALVLSLLLPSASRGADLAPDWALRTTDGETVRLSRAVQERPVILFFWATWCPYCKALMPHLQSIRLEYGDSVEILAVVILDEKGDPRGFVDEHGYDFTVLPGGDEVAKLYDVFGTPGLFIVDQERVIRWNMRELPWPDLPDDVSEWKHSRKAAHIVPYWAAELRKALDELLTR